MLICYKVISKLVNIYQASRTSFHLTKNGLLINLIIYFEIEISEQLKQHKKYGTSKNANSWQSFCTKTRIEIFGAILIVTNVEIETAMCCSSTFRSRKFIRKTF